jgi:tRNA pseudouridine38-40 synthase
MRNIRMEIAYDGTNYAGWQKQPPEKGRTIQGELERALSSLCGHPVQVQEPDVLTPVCMPPARLLLFHTTCPIPAGHLPLA